MRKRANVLLAVALSTLAAGAAAASFATQTTSDSGVIVKVTPKALDGNGQDFEVVLETHASELDDDLARSATLTVDGGTPQAPIEWRGDPPGGHHRQGILRFKGTTPTPASIELRIVRAGESAPRVFHWRLR
ncbi:MAG TPA: hypothetical protein VF428_05220 [Casimicrobiaceae bacterium]|jgi:hypothetical protein